MRDQMDAEIWNARHDQFSEWLDQRFAAAGETLGSASAAGARVPGQLLATLFAVGLTLATFGASAA